MISLTLLAVLSACASGRSDTYPSLAIRDVERQAAASVYVPEVEVVVERPIIQLPPLDPALLRRLDSLLAQARSSHVRFQSATPAARRAVSAGGRASNTSEAKSIALVALADLEAIRSETAIPLADLDRIYAQAGVERAQRPSIVETRRQIIRMIAAEDSTLASLRSQTPI